MLIAGGHKAVATGNIGTPFAAVATDTWDVAVVEVSSFHSSPLTRRQFINAKGEREFIDEDKRQEWMRKAKEQIAEHCK